MRQLFEDICPPEAIVAPAQLRLRDPGYSATSRDAGLLLRPDTTAMVAAICRTAQAQGIGIVPQGGLTGLVDGTATTADQIALSLERMTAILRVDPVQRIIVAEAGATLQQVNDAAARYGLMTGIDIPSRGNCTLGGIISTNAGGIRVIRYGMTRDNVLGLTAVLPDGTVIEDMNTLLKNNTGYDLKQLFIGSEGTLGIVTAAVLRLYPRPDTTGVALLSCPDLGAAQALLAIAQRMASGNLLSFEAMWPEYYALTSGLLCKGHEPLPPDAALKIILEVAGKDSDATEALLLSIFEDAAEAGHVADGVIAKSQTEQLAIWSIREDTDLIAQPLGAFLSYDISIEANEITGFLDRWDRARATHFPELDSFVFGHLGDCNLHVCMAVSPDTKQNRGPIDDIFYDTVTSTPGSSISAEHGIGLGKRKQLPHNRSPASLALMRQIKATLDPKAIMNPGKLLAEI
ncbi:FAD-binding oxidoreductase [Roseovarius sp.]|uniref:FAD-binding oxidoreductase n=1 Tax=Roseovarius sp. TaxID=1486281 RepID=UPI003A97D749